jgi:hypothetical protein
MAFTGDFMCTSFKQELLTATHDFTLSTGDVFNIALYDNSASFTAATTSYTSTNEVANGNGYTTGGEALTNVTPTTSGTTALTDFADVTWSTASFTAYGALVYNTTTATSPSVATVVVLDFGGAQTATNGDFVVRFPTADASNAIIRIA